MRLLKVIVAVIMVAILGIAVSATSSVTITTSVTVISPIKETSISGYINDINKTGLSGWNIQLFGIVGEGIDTRLITRNTISGSNGFYKFNDLTAGNYFLILELKPTYLPVSSPVLQTYLSSNQKSENNNFTVANISQWIAAHRSKRTVIDR